VAADVVGGGAPPTLLHSTFPDRPVVCCAGRALIVGARGPIVMALAEGDARFLIG
jgi:hypothetical protein